MSFLQKLQEKVLIYNHNKKTYMISKHFLEKYNKSDTVVVAFSGGPDSVFLAEQLLKNGYSTIICAHFNHHMDVRNGANDRDEEFVKNYAKTRNIIYEIGHWENPKNSEAKARNARYKFLENVRQKYTHIQKSVIVTGHHKNDVAETVLLQFFRSGGIKSLSGITEYDEKRNIFRPLLHLFKSEILDFLDKNNIRYCIDNSNIESVFTRNFMRNEVLPLLETRFPNIQEHLSVQASQFKRLEKDIEHQADIFLAKSSFEIVEYLDLMNDIQAEILRKILVKKAFSRKFFLKFISFLQKHIKDKISGKKLETKYQVFIVRKGVLLFESNAV